MGKTALLVSVCLLGSIFVSATAFAQRPKCKVVNEFTMANFDNLQAAVDDAMDGDKLKVEGTCYGTTFIYELINLVIEGTSNSTYGKATLDGGNAGSVLEGHPFKAGHFATSMTCREGLMTLPWQWQLVDL